MEHPILLGTHVPFSRIGFNGRQGELRIIEDPAMGRRDEKTALSLVLTRDGRIVLTLAQFDTDHDAILAINALSRATYLVGEQP